MGTIATCVKHFRLNTEKNKVSNLIQALQVMTQTIDNVKQDKQCMYDVALTRFRATIVAMEKQ